jgi:DNA mismatch endonuclease, patch repair protein
MEKILRLSLTNGEFAGTSRKRSHIMRSVKGKGNKSTEMRLRAALISNGISGWKVNPKDTFGNPDFFFPTEQVAVFVDGCFWHACTRCGHVPNSNSLFWKTKLDINRKRDKRINRQLRHHGIRVIRFWEHELEAELCKSVRLIESGLTQSSRSRYRPRNA